MKPERVTKLEYLLLAAVLLWGVFLRTKDLNRPLFWVDEAESTLNALTIHEHGIPVDHYLGIPIYENTLVRPWPESAEYEFKDSSYSDKGVAVYHGWLPLYSIAASLKAFGIGPDPAPADPRTYTPVVKHDMAYMLRMNAAARAPAALFGMLFLVLLFFAGREMGGRDVAWAAVIAATVAIRTVTISREARYYSATALLGLAACWMLFRMARRRRWQDFVIAGVVYALLFHTHVVTFIVASAALALAVVVTMRDRALLPKFGVFAAIVAVATVPWVLYTGFLTNSADIPKALPHLKFPDDYLLFPMARPPTLVVLGIGITAALMADLFRKRLPARFVNAFARHRPAFYLLSAWVVLGYLAFIFLMPAVSFVTDRMTLPMLGAGILLAAISFSAVARVIMAKTSSPVLASILFMGFMVAVGGVQYYPEESPLGIAPKVEYCVDYLRERKFRPGTRIYASPNKHLVFSVYTGIPIQNIAPVRKSFIDNYDGDIVVFDCVVKFQPPAADDVILAADQNGKKLTEQEVVDYQWFVNRRAIAVATAQEVREVNPRPEDFPLPPYLQAMSDRQPAQTKFYLKHRSNPARSCPAIFRGYELKDWTDWAPVYFYRFVSPEKRGGPNLNYAERARSGTATVLPVGWRVYDMPAPQAVQVHQQSADKGISSAAP